MFKEQVKAGAKLLDEKLPGWEEMQDLSRLNLASGERCILGQAGEGYWDTLMYLFPNASEQELHILAVEHGFNVQSCTEHECVPLTQEWKQLITERREQKNVLV